MESQVTNPSQPLFCGYTPYNLDLLYRRIIKNRNVVILDLVATQKKITPSFLFFPQATKYDMVGGSTSVPGWTRAKVQRGGEDKRKRFLKVSFSIFRSMEVQHLSLWLKIKTVSLQFLGASYIWLWSLGSQESNASNGLQN